MSRCTGRQSDRSTMDLDTIIQARAKAAARYAADRFSTRLDYKDFQDVTQSAAEGFWRAWSKKPGEMGYAIIAARNAAIRFMIRDLWGSNPFATTITDEMENCGVVLRAQREDICDLPDEILRQLQMLFLESRKKKGQRGALAAARDAFVINALHKEWSNEAIGNALDKPIDSVKKYRRRIRTVLRERSEQ